MKLYTRETGPLDKPTIVFLHGGGTPSWMWQPQMTALSDSFHCLAPDLPEHGQSMEVKPFTIRGSATMVAELIRDRVPGGKAHVVGISEGAQITVSLLSQAPEVIDHAIISSAVLRPIPFSWMLKPGMIGLMYDMSIPPFKNNDWWIRINARYAAAIPDEYFPLQKKNFQAMTRDSFVHLMVENQAFRLPPGLERVTSPVLVVVGEKEYAAMQASGRDLLKAIPNATGRIVTLGKKSSMAKEHNWGMNAPDLFNRTVRAWLTGQPLPPELLPLQV